MAGVRRVSLEAALKAGRARHESAPYRITTIRGQVRFEVGIPKFDADEVRRRSGDTVYATWERVTADHALAWPKDGWIL